MGQKTEKRERWSAGGETRPPIPPEWKEGGGHEASGVEKTLGGGNGLVVGEGLEYLGSPETPGWKDCPVGTKPPE